jgi:hypothetical protein
VYSHNPEPELAASIFRPTHLTHIAFDSELLTDNFSARSAQRRIECIVGLDLSSTAIREVSRFSGMIGSFTFIEYCL